MSRSQTVRPSAEGRCRCIANTRAVIHTARSNPTSPPLGGEVEVDVMRVDLDSLEILGERWALEEVLPPETSKAHPEKRRLEEHADGVLPEEQAQGGRPTIVR